MTDTNEELIETDVLTPAEDEEQSAKDVCVSTLEDAPLEDTEINESTEDDQKKKRRRLTVVLGSAAAFVVVVAFAVGIVLTNNASTITIEDEDTPLASPSSRSNTTQRTSGSATTSADTDDEDEGEDASNTNAPSGSSNGSSGGNSGSTGTGQGSTSGGSSSGGSNSNKVWVPGWEEQVWIDTSGYQSVYVGDNPVIEYHSVCNDCGSIISGYAAQHLLDTGHGSYSNNVPIQVGTTPVYENQWVESGYYQTIYHEGYWK